MGDNHEAYDLRAIRDLLLSAFNTEELRSLFLYATNNDLRALFNEFGPSDSLTTMVTTVILACQTRDLFDELLSVVRQSNPNKYSQFADAIHVADSGPSPASRLESDSPRIVRAPTKAAVLSVDSPRLQALWRLAYAFVRLDQLPSGGWSKTLSSWMATIWKGDTGLISRNPNMRTIGGTDFTSCTFYSYCGFLKALIRPPQMVRVLQDNMVADRVQENLVSRIGKDGGFGTDDFPRVPGSNGKLSSTRVRHTLLGIIALLVAGEAELYSHPIDLEKPPWYLVDPMHSWKDDRSFPFGMVAAAIRLYDMLSGEVAHRQLSMQQIEALQKWLEGNIPDMIQLACQRLNYMPRPEGTMVGPLKGSAFRPYYGFWRMERASFLMYLPFVVADDGNSFLGQVDRTLQTRCALNLAEMLDDVAHPGAEREPTEYLIRYHRDSNTANAPRDWGLSAEFASLLFTNAVRDLLVTAGWVDAELYDQKREALARALLETFDTYFRNAMVFEFTHSLSFGKVLQLVPRTWVKLDAIRELDHAISRTCSQGVTERSLQALVQEQIAREAGPDIDRKAIRDFLLDKLESGEYTPGGPCVPNEWQKQIQTAVDTSTIGFYESPLGAKYAARYGSAPRLDLVSKLEYKLDLSNQEHRLALDVGCGPGQYAQALEEMGFEVHLLDASKKMLDMAAERLGLPQDRFSLKSIYEPDWGYEESAFDLVFACALMVHVPRAEAQRIYEAFHRLLKPQGVLFVNFKLGDHSLISEDGRFFEYYRDQSDPERGLRHAGFEVEEVSITYNYGNMYEIPKKIQWANFYCRKPMNRYAEQDRVRSRKDSG